MQVKLMARITDKKAGKVKDKNTARPLTEREIKQKGVFCVALMQMLQGKTNGFWSGP
ncbi:hypothetical protein [Pantoea ananatis]|uniref:hypothetical protein n=1 Tax=Pantoea ananas TaxID=553 RepID=UPI0015F24C91|nr:hypothetical protein [Pantoea ananatis]BBL30327.1 hypothetical protein PAFU01_17750 [Pantoea ananatis]